MSVELLLAGIGFAIVTLIVQLDRIIDILKDNRKELKRNVACNSFSNDNDNE